MVSGWDVVMDATETVPVLSPLLLAKLRSLAVIRPGSAKSLTLVYHVLALWIIHWAIGEED